MSYHRTSPLSICQGEQAKAIERKETTALDMGLLETVFFINNPPPLKIEALQGATGQGA